MAKKQTRRSISVSRATYDRLKAFCESNGISMSQFVENRVGDALSHDGRHEAPVSKPAPVPSPPQAVVAPVAAALQPAKPVVEAPVQRPAAPAPLTSAAARIAVEPPPPVIKPRTEQPAPKPAEKRPDQIFTF